MADTNTVLQFLDLAGTIELKDKILAYVDTKDTAINAASIKGVGIDGNTLLFYKTLPIEGATATYEIELPETDLSNVMNLVASAVENNIAIFNNAGQVKDSGKKLSDFYVKGDIDGLLSTLEGKVDKNTEDITKLGTAVDTKIGVAKTELNDTIKGVRDALEESIGNVDGKANANATKIGNLDNLETTGKSDLVTALNEVRNAVSAGGTEAQVTMTASDSTDYAKVYTFKQGNNTIGSVNIPKDLVVQSGDVVVNPVGQTAGTYLKLVLANAENSEIFINVGTLVDIYQAEGDATQVQIAINSTTREISATIVAGSIGSNEVAASAILTGHIANGNVTLAKLSATVQASLTKADNAAPQSKLDEEVSRATQAEGALGTRIKTLEDAIGESGSVAEDIAEALGEAKEYTDTEVKEVTDKIGEVTEGKTLVQMINESVYNDEGIQALVAANKKSITDLEAKHNAEKKTLDAKDKEHDDAIAGHDTAIADLETAVGNIQAIPVETITKMFA